MKKNIVIGIIGFIVLILSILGYVKYNENNTSNIGIGIGNIGIGSNTSSFKNNNSEYLKKYTFSKDELEQYQIEAYNMEHKFIKIKHKEYNDLIESKLLKFKNIFGDLKFKKNSKDAVLTSESYESNDINLVILKKQLKKFNTLSDLDGIEEEYPDVNVKKTFSRHNITNDLDLKYNLIKNLDKRVDESSSKNEILDKFTFDALYLMNMVNANKILIFTGDQYGYAAWLKSEVLAICLKYDNDYDVTLMISYKDKRKIDFTDEQVINLVSSIKK